MRTVLLLTSCFFPAPYVGGVRATQWARWLPENGWRVVVACKNHGHVATREELDRQVHPSVDIRYLTDGPSPFAAVRGGRYATAKQAAARLMGKYVLAPDPGIIFWRSIGDTLVRMVADIQPDLMITTAPPQSVHAAALKLKQEFPQLPWLADFRDPFRPDGRYKVTMPEQLRSIRSSRFETRVYQTADCLTCAIPTHARLIRKRFPAAAEKAHLLPNGVPQELCGGARQQPRRRRNTLRLKVIGFNDTPDVVSLARAVAMLRQGGTDLRLRFVGREPPFRAEVKAALGDAVEFTGMVPHPDAIRETSTADVLVALLSEERSRTHGLTSKLFEYLAIPAPVLVINPTRADRLLFSRLGGLLMATGSPPEAIRHALEECLQSPEHILSERAIDVQSRWGRRLQAQQLANLMDGLCVRHDRETPTFGQPAQFMTPPINSAGLSPGSNTGERLMNEPRGGGQ